MNKRKLRHFNRVNFMKQVSKLKEEIPTAIKLKRNLVAFVGCETLEEIQDYLNGKTGFLNAEMSASAMGMEMQYFYIKNHIAKIDFNNYNEKLTDVANDVIERLREENSTYYNEGDSKLLTKAEKITKTLNELPQHIREVIFLNKYKEFILDEHRFNFLSQMNKRL